MPEVIEDNKTGFVVDYDNDDELVEKLAILAKNPDLCKQMGIQARKKVAKDFANGIMIKKLEEIYKSL